MFVKVSPHQNVFYNNFRITNCSHMSLWVFSKICNICSSKYLGIYCYSVKESRILKPLKYVNLEAKNTSFKLEVMNFNAADKILFSITRSKKFLRKRKSIYTSFLNICCALVFHEIIFYFLVHLYLSCCLYLLKNIFFSNIKLSIKNNVCLLKKKYSNLYIITKLF